LREQVVDFPRLEHDVLALHQVFVADEPTVELPAAPWWRMTAPRRTLPGVRREPRRTTGDISGDDMIHRTNLRPIAAAAIALTLGTLGAGCGSDSTEKVEVSLQEYKINVKDGDAKAGKIEFQAENIGGTTHEFVVVRADDAESLPTKPDGSVDEEKLDAANQIGELEDLEPKAKENVTFDLKPGNYVFFCNVVQDEVDPPVSHFEKGMHAQFTVSD
jgi:uncharacterized cupredoxin-like copper-binding protein